MLFDKIEKYVEILSVFMIYHKLTGDHRFLPNLLINQKLLSGEPDYFGPNEISSGGDLSHYSSASLY